MPWIIFDFAGVIGRHQPQQDQDAIVAAATPVSATEFWDAYWRYRDSYDMGRVSAVEYWTKVLEQSKGTISPAVIAELTRLDVASWLYPNTGTVDLIEEFTGRGVSMALLSNCPRELATALEALPWLGRLERLFFSSHLGIVKPDIKIYLTVAADLETEPKDCCFVDDRPANVRGAVEAGMGGVVFTDADALRKSLMEWLAAR